MRKPKAVIFDFDGVLVDSNDIKAAAFAELFQWAGPAVVKKVLAHHRANGGMSRAEKFQIYYREFLGTSLAEQQLEELCLAFQQLVLERVIGASWVPGALDILARCRATGRLMFVVSATPEAEIREIVSRRGIADFFKGVFGSPTTKAGAIRDVLHAYGLEPTEVLYIGDSWADLEAARDTSVRFVGRRSGEIDWQHLGVESVVDLSCIAAL